MPFATKHNKRIKVQGSLETLRLETLYLAPPQLGEAFVGTKGVSQNHLLSFDDNKVLKIINWIC